MLSCDGDPADEAVGSEVHLDLSQHPSYSGSAPLELEEEETGQGCETQSQDGRLQRCGQLDKRWILWHEFMKEHAHLDTWLRFAEQAVTSLSPAYITYSVAKEELKKFERLRSEAGSQLIQVDSLTRRNRTLTRLFQGTMQARLLASARECGQRWDDVNAKLESTGAQLQRFITEWEEFEAEREELGLWLADMDACLTEIDHMTGSNCKKLRRLQSFQQSVCENSGRVNALLQRGEVLIQRCQPADAQHVEGRLLELLRRCSHVYNNIASTHTRLLSMRLVFEDDWILSPTSDSGCPSESLHDGEEAFDKYHLDLPSVSNRLKDLRASGNSAAASPPRRPSPTHHPPPPPSPSFPTHEHMGLEWDPSVDIGRSVSHDDADSSYFSASTGLCQRGGMKRWSYLSSFDSVSDISADLTNQEVDVGSEEWLDHAAPRLLALRQDGDQWTTSTPAREDDEPMRFDGGRVKAWLSVQSSTPSENRTSCSKAVQTDGEVKGLDDCRHTDQLKRRYDDTHHLPVSLLLASHCLDTKPWERRTHLQPDLQDFSCCEEDEQLLSDQRLTSRAAASCSSSALLLLAAALVLFGSLIAVVMEPPCHRGNQMFRTFHLMLSYVNGPPPT
ncbi:nesprin-2 isoform X2 [Nothobranchius furzeri]|uniref:nesprin-2 isoform X2 n=1 Tax=Nothobranchius furzeri TaxID=105023 RepID=UPI003904DB88